METFPTSEGAASGGSAAGNRKPLDNTLTLSADGKDYIGWTAIRVTRRLEGCPSDFEISLTERFPGQAANAVVFPGDPCTIKIGDTVILTGYVDRYAPSISPHGHTVRVSGRGKCQDIVDCSVTPDAINGMTISTVSLWELASKLSAPFGISVTSLTGDDVPVSSAGGGPAQFSAILTETPYEIIERVARSAGVLTYEGTDGNLIIANVGTGTHSSGFAQGVNVQAAAASYSMDGRYSDYLPMLLSVNFYGQEGIGGQQFQRAYDKGVPRFRPLIVVSEQFQLGQSFAEKRARWEMARRFGRAQAVRITADSWRDSGGTLWAPNFFAPVKLPSLKVQPPSPWVIGEVTFTMDQERGTVADLVLMPKDAFLPEPSILLPSLPDAPGAPPAGGAAADPGDRGPGLG